MNRRFRRNLSRWGSILPLLVLCSTSGCVPGMALNQVLGENLLLLATTVIQAFTGLVFNNFFGV